MKFSFGKKFFFIMLLSLVLPLSIFSQSQKRLTYAMIMQLDIVPVSEKNYAGQECCFELKIPYTKADAVQSTIPDLPSGVTFVSLRRSEYSDEEFGTKIELWLNFSEPGTYKLRFMRIIINNQTYSIPFTPIKISENPRDMLPQLVIAFENGKEVVQQKKSKSYSKALFSTEEGENLRFTVYLQYAVQLVNFWWGVPKGSLFTEVERFDITQGKLRSSEFSEERIPVATFDWKPLMKGEVSLPEMRFVATSYNGSRVQLSFPDAFIRVLESTAVPEKADDYSSMFKGAFSASKKSEEVESVFVIGRNELEEISRLRSVEKNSLPFSKASAERRKYEESLGIAGEQGEFSWITFYVFSCAALFFLIVLLLCLIFKRISGFILSTTAFLAFLVLSFVTVVSLKKESGIFAGGKIRAVPEVQGEAVESIPSGKKVLVEEKAGSWYYIRYGSSGGWTDESSVILIGGTKSQEASKN